MLQTEEGRDILRRRPRVSTESLDFANLSTLPSHTFGHQHYLFFTSHGISPDTRCPVQYIEEDELAYVMQRYRENHDFIHTLTGLSISVIDEIALKRFEFHQTRLPMAAFSSTLGALSLRSPSEIAVLYQRYIPWADRAGRECASYMEVDFEGLLKMPIEDVRRKLNLHPFPLYK